MKKALLPPGSNVLDVADRSALQSFTVPGRLYKRSWMFHERFQPFEISLWPEKPRNGHETFRNGERSGTLDGLKRSYINGLKRIQNHVHVSKPGILNYCTKLNPMILLAFKKTVANQSYSIYYVFGKFSFFALF